MVLFDTNILLLFLNGNTKVQKMITDVFNRRERMAISLLTHVELHSLVTDRSRVNIFSEMPGFQILPLTEEISERAIRIRRTYNLKTVDAIIAATAQEARIPLVSNDWIFQRVKEIRLIQAMD